MKKKRSKYEGRLLKKIAKFGYSRLQFAKLSGLCLNTLINIDEGIRIPHQSSVSKVERGFRKIEARL